VEKRGVELTKVHVTQGTMEAPGNNGERVGPEPEVVQHHFDKKPEDYYPTERTSTHY
jgi:hypothetical protein